LADLEGQQSCAANEVQLRVAGLSLAGRNVASATPAVYAAARL
jgi:hypothetical protein